MISSELRNRYNECVYENKVKFELRNNSILFFPCCLYLGCIIFVCFCLYKYSLNKDLSQVTFKEFHKTKKNIYPSLTLCFANIFYEENLKEYGVKSINDYVNYINGKHWNDRMIDVDYDNVTLNIGDYLLGFVSKTPARTAWIPYEDEYFVYDNTKNTRGIENESISTYDWTPKIYSSYAGGIQKCMSVDIPFSKGKKCGLLELFLIRAFFQKESGLNTKNLE